jgi:hypothetical protein
VGIGSGVSGMSGSGFVGGTSLGGVSEETWDWRDGLGMATSWQPTYPGPLGSKPIESTSDGRDVLWMP